MSLYSRLSLFILAFSIFALATQQPSGGQQWAMHATVDIKCVVPDAQDAGSGTRFCIRGGTDCSQLEKLVEKFSQ
ncbi:hypothetical protein BJV77DRAFT_1024234 [Russula vinacea]|nr:hypothetical protein BJV77DRAFT_1024234 [Russula vinacea]